MILQSVRLLIIVIVIAKVEYIIQFLLGRWSYDLDWQACENQYEEVYYGVSYSETSRNETGIGSLIVANNSAHDQYSAVKLTEETSICGRSAFATKFKNFFVLFPKNELHKLHLHEVSGINLDFTVGLGTLGNFISIQFNQGLQAVYDFVAVQDCEASRA